jgi:hypothetical protein
MTEWEQARKTADEVIRRHTIKAEPNETKAESQYVATAKRLGALVEQKQAAYGDATGRSGEVFRQLYPNGIKPEEYDDALGVVRVVDKLFRIATDRDAFGESPWDDIAGYAIRYASRAKGGAK